MKDPLFNILARSFASEVLMMNKHLQRQLQQPSYGESVSFPIIASFKFECR